MSKTIIIVDDFKTNTIVMSSALSLVGHEVIEANSPLEALKYFDGRKIDLMVTDYKMPEMNGAELTKAVKSNHDYEKLPVIILSSEQSQTSKKEAREAGAYGWLNKPFDIKKFSRVIKSIA